MMQKFIHQQRLLLLLVLVCAGCASASQPGNAALSVTASVKMADFVQSTPADQLWAKPLPVPAFLLLESNALQHDFLPTDKICMRVRQDAIWETGDKQLDAFTRNVIANSTVKVDNSAISLKKLIISQTLSQVSITDKAGNVVAVVEDPLQYCVELSNLSVGLHKASVQVVATSGTVYAYAWAFRIAKASSSIEGL